MDQGFKNEKEVNPREKANIFSILTFFLFKKGYKKDLEQNDLYEVLTSCRSKALGDQIENKWEIDKKLHKSPSICRVLWSCFGKTYLLFGLTQLIAKTIMIISVPEAMGKLISYFAPGQSKVTQEEAYFYASVVIGFGILNTIYIQNYMMALTELGIRVRTAICSLIYRKCLKLCTNTLSEISMGKIITLITKDIEAFEMFILFGNDIWIGIVQTFLICYLIYRKIGYATFSGIGCFLIFLPLQIMIGKMATKFRLQTCKKTDERLQVTQESLSAIKIIKMYTWEKFFHDKISTARRKEVNAIHKLFYMKAIIIVIGGLSAKIAFYFLIMTYVWGGHNITAEIVYFIMGCFSKLKHVLSIMIPFGISHIAELYATITRLRTILEAKELPQPKEISTVIIPKVIFDNVSVKFGNKEILKNISLNIEKGLNIITGHVGSGKSIFLKTILQDHKFDGNLWIYGKISYASQEPWLFPSTIKQNILFGENFIEKRYNEILKICALEYDLKLLHDGDKTIVGDRGVNLSKGQQARINLARAIYKNSDIYLLDDCLSALDHSVADYIFNECVKKFLKDKMCVFVTQNNDHIRNADKVLIISEGLIKSSINLGDDVVQDIDDIELEKEESIIAEKMPKVPDVEKQIYKENKKSGKIDISVYKNYINFGGGFIVLSVVLVVFVSAQTTISYTEKLISNWVTLEQNISDFKFKNMTKTTEFETIMDKRSNILIIYTVMIIASTILSLTRSFAFYNFTRIASINMHKLMIYKIINASMQFFDSHFIGNILNRFSKDLCTIDEFLPFSLYECLQMICFLVGIIFLICTVNALFLIPAIIFLAIAYFFRSIYQPTGRSLQRLDAATRSPLIGHVNATLEGLTTVRAFKAQELLKDEFDRHQDLYTSANYTMNCTLKALGFNLDAICSVFIAIIIIRFLVVDIDTSVGNVGLAISQAFALTGLVQFGIKIWSECENQMTSVERVMEYTQTKQEKENGEFSKNWPNKGEIAYDNVSLCYNNNNKNQVLKNISFVIKSKEKIGVIGRTGAGKSSLIATLFRLYDIENTGKILIDNVNTKHVSLNCLRSNITLIPQDAILFSGTIRENLDPLKQLTDEEMWNILEIVKLKDSVKDLSMNYNGSDFSAGQKQLICLARAIARKNKIVILDEATANMDPETDYLILTIIKENFANCTVIIIAHRLNSINDSDKIMVIDKGTIVEFDEPAKLLSNVESLFYKMTKLS